MYQRQALVKPKIMDNELIDISSEDSEEEAAYNNCNKKSNGAAPSASTSQNRGVIVQQSNSNSNKTMVSSKQTLIGLSLATSELNFLTVLPQNQVRFTCGGQVKKT